jgi:endoglucanase
MPVVITMLSLPGSRWKQNNNDQDDLRIWNEKDYQRQAAVFWQELALKLKDHSAVVGYNILNEPHPERLYDLASIHVQEA